MPWDGISTTTLLLGWNALNWGEGRSRNPKYGTKISFKRWGTLAKLYCILCHVFSQVEVFRQCFYAICIYLGCLWWHISHNTGAVPSRMCCSKCLLCPFLINMVLWAFWSQRHPYQWKKTQLKLVSRVLHSLLSTSQVNFSALEIRDDIEPADCRNPWTDHRLTWLPPAVPEQLFILNHCYSLAIVSTGTLGKGCTWLLQDYRATHHCYIMAMLGVYVQPYY